MGKGPEAPRVERGGGWAKASRLPGWRGGWGMGKGLEAPRVERGWGMGKGLEAPRVERGGMGKSLEDRSGVKRTRARNRLKIGVRGEGTVSNQLLETRRLPRTDG